MKTMKISKKNDIFDKKILIVEIDINYDRNILKFELKCSIRKAKNFV
jgi:hypothetical protein